MTNEILEALQSLEAAILSQAAQDRKDKRFLEQITYYKRQKGVKQDRVKGEKGSKLFKKYAQEERKDSMFRGNMEDVKRMREEALAKTEVEREEELKAEVEAQKIIDEEQHDDKQVLANSEEKPKRKRRTTRKKTDK